MVVAGDETSKRFHTDCPYFNGCDLFILSTSWVASAISSSKVFLVLLPAATIPELTIRFVCESTLSILPASLESFDSKSLRLIPLVSANSPSVNSVYLPIALFIFTKSSSGKNLTTLVTTSAVNLLECIFKPLSFISFASPPLPSAPSIILENKSDGMTAASSFKPLSTFEFHASMSSSICLVTFLPSFLDSIAELLSITVLAISPSVSVGSSSPDIPRNLPKPSCAAPATPPSKEEKPICALLKSSCAPASIKVFCASVSCSIANPASAPTVTFKAVPLALSNNSSCLPFMASSATFLRPSLVTSCVTFSAAFLD